MVHSLTVDVARERPGWTIYRATIGGARVLLLLFTSHPFFRELSDRLALPGPHDLHLLQSWIHPSTFFITEYMR